MKTKAYLFVAFLALSVSNCFAQYPTVTPKIYGASPFQDSLWAIDTTTFTVSDNFAPSLSGFTITGITGMAYDPATFQTYVIMKVSGVTGRVLGTIDLSTGVCSQIGNLGDNFSSIIFDRYGQLYGITGDGATVPESFFTIDKTNAFTSLVFGMGNGLDGEVLCYNRMDEHFYHWSGNGTVVYEKWPATNLTYAPVNIPISGSAGGETFGAMYLNQNKFIISNISSNLRRWDVNGTVDAAILSNNPDDLRGLVMPPQFAISADTICQNADTVFIGAGCLQEFDSVIYHWGDGTTTTVGTTGAFHVYTSPGSYTINIELNNGVLSDTIPTQFQLEVNNTPNVVLSGVSGICPGGSVVLTATSGGSSQWYLNGVAVPGETSPSITTNQPGVYNMIKTNNNGCADSAAVGINLVNVPNPVVDLSADSIVCSYVTNVPLTGIPAGGMYSGTSVTGSNFDASIGIGSYNVYYEYTDTNNCSSVDTLIITVEDCTGLNELDEELFTIHPNPSSGVFTISIDNQQMNNSGEIIILNVLGQIIFRQELTPKAIDINLQGNEAGIYYVKIVSDKGTKVAQIVLR